MIADKLTVNSCAAACNDYLRSIRTYLRDDPEVASTWRARNRLKPGDDEPNMPTQILVGDAVDQLRTLPAGSVQCCVTSPPYFGLRSYGGGAAEVGTEATPEAYLARLVEVFEEVRRVLRDDGTLWLNLGDSYAANRAQQVSPTKWPSLQQGQSSRVPAGCKPKDLLGIPWAAAFALRSAGWYLRSSIVWHKPNPMPESVTDRPTQAHEMVFLLAKSPRYFYQAEAIAEAAAIVADGRVQYSNRTGRRHAESDRNDADRTTSIGFGAGASGTRNARNVWTIAPKPFSIAHFAVMPPELASRCIKAGSRPGDVVLDPFGGAGTTAVAAEALGRSAILVELNPAYAALAADRLKGVQPALPWIAAVTPRRTFLDLARAQQAQAARL